MVRGKWNIVRTRSRRSELLPWRFSLSRWWRLLPWKPHRLLRLLSCWPFSPVNFFPLRRQHCRRNSLSCSWKFVCNPRKIHRHSNCHWLHWSSTRWWRSNEDDYPQLISVFPPENHGKISIARSRFPLWLLFSSRMFASVASARNSAAECLFWNDLSRRMPEP